MPQTPEDLSKIIREMAQRQAKERNKELDKNAEDRIAEIPAPYRSQERISVDLSRLEMMISEVIGIAASLSDNGIGFAEIERALTEVKCHYLWFC